MSKGTIPAVTSIGLREARRPDSTTFRAKEYHVFCSLSGNNIRHARVVLSGSSSPDMDLQSVCVYELVDLQTAYVYVFLDGR